MAYKELKTLYYGNHDLYAEEYLRRFNSEDSIKIDFTIGDNQAFFLQNSEVLLLALKITKLNHAIEKLCSSLPGAALDQYSKKCLIDEIVLTNRIEGVHSSRREIGDALETLETQSFEKKGKHSRFIGFVNKYMKLFSSEDIRLQESCDIRKLYDEIFLQEVLHENPSNLPDGTLFRKNSVSVYSDTGKEIHRGVLPESKIIESVDKALRFLNDDSVEELFRICIFHYFFEYIHPFYDGNGRIGRFIYSYGISQNLCFLISFKISETIKKNINAYYKAFKTCNDPRNLGDLTPFLMMQLTLLYSSMLELKTSLEERKATWMKYEKLVRNDYGNDRELGKLYSILIQASLFSESGVSMKEIGSSMKCSAYLIKNMMTKIPESLIEIRKKGNSKYYNIDINVLNKRLLDESVRAIANPQGNAE